MAQLEQKTEVDTNIFDNVESEKALASLGTAAETGEDLAIERSGKERVKSFADEDLPDVKGPIVGLESVSETLDPICGKAVKERSAPRVERDGKTFYFCSDRCLQTFLSTIAGVKSDSKAGSCCG